MVHHKHYNVIQRSSYWGTWKSALSANDLHRAKASHTSRSREPLRPSSAVIAAILRGENSGFYAAEISWFWVCIEMLLRGALPPSFWMACWMVIRCPGIPAILAAELILVTTEAVPPAFTSVRDSRHWFFIRSYRTRFPPYIKIQHYNII